MTANRKRGGAAPAAWQSVGKLGPSRRQRALMIEAPLLPNEVQRLKALHDLGVLYARAEERFDRITRPYDAIGRYGGEEFLLVLGDCSERTARQIADSVRLNVATESAATARKSVSLTVSMGI